MWLSLLQFNLLARSSRWMISLIRYARTNPLVSWNSCANRAAFSLLPVTHLSAPRLRVQAYARPRWQPSEPRLQTGRKMFEFSQARGTAAHLCPSTARATSELRRFWRALPCDMHVIGPKGSLP